MVFSTTVPLSDPLWQGHLKVAYRTPPAQNCGDLLGPPPLQHQQDRPRPVRFAAVLRFRQGTQHGLFRSNEMDESVAAAYSPNHQELQETNTKHDLTNFSDISQNIRPMS